MTATDATAPRQRAPRGIDVALSGLLAFALYLLLGQSAIYGDAFSFFVRLREGSTDHSAHAGYLVVLSAFTDLTTSWGLTLYQGALLLSQLGAASGVALIHLAARVHGLGRRDAWLAAALVACCPSVVFFATVVEAQGPFFAFAALSLVATADLARRPTWWRAVAVGASAALAYWFHAAGLLLPWPLLLVFLACRLGDAAPGPERRRVLSCAAVLVTAFAVSLLLLVWALRSGGRTASPGAAVDFVLAGAREALQNPARLPAVAWNEWIWPYMPVSLLWLLAFRRRCMRRLAIAVFVAVATYLAASYLILRAGWVEHGAYLHPLAWPTAWLAVGALRWRPVAVVLALSLALSIFTVAQHDDPARSRKYARGVQEIARGGKVYIVGVDDTDLEGSLVGLPDTPFLFIGSTLFLREDLAPRTLAALDDLIAEQWNDGVQVLLTSGAEAWLSNAHAQALHPGLRMTLQHLRAHYRLDAVEAHGFRGKRMLPK